MIVIVMIVIVMIVIKDFGREGGFHAHKYINNIYITYEDCCTLFSLMTVMTMTIVTTSRVNLKIYGLKLNGKISCQSFVNRNASTVSLLCQNEVGKFLPNWAVKFPSLEKKISPVRQ